MSEKSKKVFESRGLHGQEDRVNSIKLIAEEFWDMIDNIPIPPGNSEAGRLIALAKTDLESSVMWAVKAVSRYQ